MVNIDYGYILKITTQFKSDIQRLLNILLSVDIDSELIPASQSVFVINLVFRFSNVV